MDKEKLNQPYKVSGEQRTVPGGNVSGGRNLYSTGSLFPTTCTQVPWRESRIFDRDAFPTNYCRTGLLSRSFSDQALNAWIASRAESSSV